MDQVGLKLCEQLNAMTLLKRSKFQLKFPDKRNQDQSIYL